VATVVKLVFTGPNADIRDLAGQLADAFRKAKTAGRYEGVELVGGPTLSQSSPPPYTIERALANAAGGAPAA
jgi:hypothetical protein